MKAVEVSRFVVVLGFAWASAAGAATFRVTVESPPVVSDLTQAYPLPPLELGTNLSSLYYASVHLSGVHTNGWWVGDGIEDHYVGPAGADLVVYLFVGGGIHVPGLTNGGWYEGGLAYTNDGPISSALTLKPTAPDLVEVPYVADGQVALCLVSWPIVGFGQMVSDPYLRVDQIDVRLEDSPAIRLALDPADGTLSWSGVPGSGSLEILSATDPNGPWELERRLPAADGSLALVWPPSAAARLFRLRWSEASLP